jgi:hypothetical protein
MLQLTLIEFASAFCVKTSAASKATIKAHAKRHIVQETRLVVVECCIDAS